MSSVEAFTCKRIIEGLVTIETVVVRQYKSEKFKLMSGEIILSKLATVKVNRIQKLPFRAQSFRQSGAELVERWGSNVIFLFVKLVPSVDKLSIPWIVELIILPSFSRNFVTSWNGAIAVRH